MEVKEGKSTDGLHPADVVLPIKEIHTWMHECRIPSLPSEKKVEAQRLLMEQIRRDEMLSLYQQLCSEFGWIEDEQLVERLTEANKKELDELEAAIVDAQVNFGDVELKDCCLAKANFFCRTYQLEEAIKAYEVAQEKTVGAGGKLNITLTLIRIGILYNLPDLSKKYIDLAKKECVAGGDWEKRNKLKVYEGLYLCEHGRFEEAAELFFSCVPIFNASEIIQFEKFIHMTVVLTMVAFDCPTLKSKVMTSPQMAQVLQESPLYKNLLHKFFYREYKDFTIVLVEIYYELRINPYLMKHAHYLFRVMRLKAYQQYMNPFGSLLIKSMADAFGLTEEIVERDVAEFIANGKLSCQIDRINKVIECTRHVAIDDHYLEAVKEGDLLLEKLQNLSKIINM